jgi:hypothetical protein
MVMIMIMMMMSMSISMTDEDEDEVEHWDFWGRCSKGNKTFSEKPWINLGW